MKPAIRNLGLAALAITLLCFLVDTWVAAQRQEDFSEALSRLTYHLESLPARVQAQGAGQVLGGISSRTREIARGKLPPDAPEVLQILRYVARTVDAENAFIVNQEGRIVAYYIAQGNSGTGRSLQQRPYIRAALGGHANMYAAIGGNTSERGIYVASPLRDGEDLNAPIIGAVVLKIGFDEVDRLLANTPGDYCLLSPEGVVFSASNAKNLFRINARAEQLDGIAQNQRASRIFERQPPLPLSESFQIKHALSGTVDWGDPEGKWQLLAQAPVRLGLHPGELFALILAGSLLALLLHIISAMRQRQRDAAQAATDQITAHAREIERIALLRAELAERSIALQQCPDLHALGQTFLAQVCQRLPIRQGTLYYHNPYQPDCLQFAAGYGSQTDSGAPESIAFSDGLLGECARQRRTLRIDAPPDGFWRIRLGSGDMAPCQLLIIPLIREEQLLGVLELAVLSPLSKEEETFLTDLHALLAMNLGIVLSREF